MVLKQRHSLRGLSPHPPRPGCSRSTSAPSPGGGGVSLPMGDGRISPRHSSSSGPAPRAGSFFGGGRGGGGGGGGTPRLETRSSSGLSPGAQPLSPSFFGEQQTPPSSTKVDRRRSGGSPVFYNSSRSSPRDFQSPYKANNAWNASTGLNLTTILSGTMMLVVGYFILSTSMQLRDREDQLSRLRNDFHVLHHKMRETDVALGDAHVTNHELEIRAQRLEKDNTKLRNELNEAKKGMELGDVLLEGKQMSGLAQDEINGLLIRRQNAMKSRIKTLQTQIQLISRREVEERFGPGPHRVEFSVMMEDSKAGKKFFGSKLGNFTVELAPLDIMPHSVHLFLQMIVHKLWDDTIFLHTAHHVLQAAPLTYPSGNSKRENFEKAGLSHLSFQEYSEDYPHEKYTLGFGGRPAGPDFYISTQDNSDYHGPGGQDHHDLHEEADPCFGKVVDGIEVVNRLHRRSAAMVNSNRDGWEGTDIPISTIVSVRLL